jgi:hypothetical protein
MTRVTVAALQPAHGQNLADSHRAISQSTALAPHYEPSLDPMLAESSADAAAAALPMPSYGPWVKVGKWASLGMAIGFGAAGAMISDDAAKLFLRIELICLADTEACAQNPDGSYTDPILEEMYQTVQQKDKQARTTFIIAEVSFLASITLFVVDFMRGGGPENKPYDPDEGQGGGLQFSAVPGELALRYYLQ